jgi:uncharacterized protein (TIGR03435 family)
MPKAPYLFLLACSAFGQVVDSQPQFEVASIRALRTQSNSSRPYGVVTGGPGTEDPGRIRYSAVPLKYVIMLAYGIPRTTSLATDLVVGPPWLTSEKYDIVANVPAGAKEEQIGLMVQNLLAERFNLVLHHETREVPGYELVVIKGSLKLKQSTDRDPVLGGLGALQDDQDGYPIVPPGFIATRATIRDGRRLMTARNQTIADLIQDCCSMDHVVDKTGLTGRFNYKLETRRPSFTGGPPIIEQNMGEPSGPDFPEALEKQLGLKLQKKKVSIDVLVVDHVEKTPTAN